MVEPARAASAARPPHPQHCPSWCIDCRHDDADPFSPRALLHRGAADIVHAYDDACLLVETQVRVAYWDKAPDWIGTDPTDLEHPYVEISGPTEDDLHLSLTPEHARALAAALLRAADTADTAV
ncbi:DUF6907 domain-containing protein [Micromonospora andamanensis]|uniref:Uncharacterized protein n=1 Tax=Micromonospora andamanensis TaxID=1287068 RepID=A0ABQ4I434_9ACTN|nr:hypothetical protein [Micromonospora andamanensis]GIJ12630.1 hypothetical protein Van01_58440 [Micromonospora andamanensis]